MRPLARVGFVVVTVGLATGTAWGGKARPRFEPTDLELENPGVLDIDLQLGFASRTDGGRAVLPDFELDLGLWNGIELDVDGALNASDLGGFPIRHADPESLWVSGKVGLWDHRDASGRAWALGAQAGPKLPTERGTRGVGGEGMLLLGRMAGPVHLVLDVGAVFDPAQADGHRPFGVETGLDLDYDLDTHDTWSLLGEATFVHFGSADDDQLSATLGLQYSIGPRLDLSVVGLVGLLAGSDRYGLLLGISPKFALW